MKKSPSLFANAITNAQMHEKICYRLLLLATILKDTNAAIILCYKTT